MGQAIIIMGVSGCGKSTLGEKLAEAIDGIYIEGDELHPENNIEKMSTGKPLEDEDRWPWFDQIIANVEEGLSTGTTVFIGCSALKEIYREYLDKHVSGDLRFIHLEGSFQTIHDRMKSRNHFMPPELLKSQFQTLESPEYEAEKCLALSIENPVQDLVNKALSWM